MTIRLHAANVSGTVLAPPSKSHSHRAFILAALCGNGSIRHALDSDDTRATLDCLRQLGFLSSVLPHETRVGGTFRAPKDPLDAHESGTTLRLLTGFASLQNAETRFTGAPGLAKRPMKPLLDALRQLGAHVAPDASHIPFLIRGPLVGGETTLPGDVSSQFISALLLACPVAPQDTTIHIDGMITSRPYVDITLHQLRHHGIDVREEHSAFHVRAAQRVRQKPYDVPGDYSSAAFLLSAAAVTNGSVTIDNLPREDPQGDRRIVEQLGSFGVAIEAHERSVTVNGGTLQAADINVNQTPDLFPVLCAVAACAKGTSRLSGAPHLRSKESDRIHSMAVNLGAAGIQAKELPDGIEIRGGAPRGATIQSFGDHRIAMALSVLALASSGETTLPDEHVVAKSYPGFFKDLKRVAPEVVVA
jgi:3-phosphoshikimate 1-carboxyvinyltransferase